MYCCIFRDITNVVKSVITPQFALCVLYVLPTRPSLGSFAQWQYHSQWGLSEAWLLLVENYTQYPALRTWNMVLCAIFDCSYGSDIQKKNVCHYISPLLQCQVDIQHMCITFMINFRQKDTNSLKCLIF